MGIKKPLIEREIIFLAGVHAVGKTYFCQSIEKDFLFEPHSASTLIKHLAVSKEVENVKGNQDLLIRALEKQQSAFDRIVLDGHFCIQNKKGEIEDVPIETFKAMSPVSIILLTLDPEVISQRLLERDNTYKSPDFMAKFQEREIERAEYVSHTLSIPLVRLDSLDSYHNIRQKIEGLFR